MGEKSWSATRKKLEQDLLAPSLKGRVSYQYTRYRKVHDEEPRAAVYVDGELFIDGTVFKYFSAKYMEMEHTIFEEKGYIYDEARDLYDQVETIRLEDGCFDGYMFIEAVNEFFNMDIQTAIQNKNPIIRMLALMDRRLGKRTFERVKVKYFVEPDWLKNFYILRFESEKGW